MSVYNEYEQCIKENLELEPSEWTFKEDNRYRNITEHVTPEDGLALWDCYLTESNSLHHNDLFKMIKENDKYGYQTEEHLYDYNFIKCSPTNFRYIYHAFLIYRHFIKSQCRQIIEIGGGYGGLSYFLHYFDTSSRIIRYGFMDLPNAAKLQVKYANELNGELGQNYELNIENDWKDYYLISNYALGELNPDIQKQYQPVIDKSKSGFVLWNSRHSYDELFKDKNISIEPERPYMRFDNKFIRW